MKIPKHSEFLLGCTTRRSGHQKPGSNRAGICFFLKHSNNLDSHTRGTCEGFFPLKKPPKLNQTQTKPSPHFIMKIIWKKTPHIRAIHFHCLRCSRNSMAGGMDRGLSTPPDPTKSAYPHTGPRGGIKPRHLSNANALPSPQSPRAGCLLKLCLQHHPLRAGMGKAVVASAQPRQRDLPAL